MRGSKAVDTSTDLLLTTGLVMSTCLGDKEPEFLCLSARAGKIDN